MIRFFTLLMSLVLASCADTTPDPRARISEPCSEGTAQIGIYDGFLQNLCGCQEGYGEPVPSGTELTCTVPLNTSVTFLYLATQAPHQILSEGDPSFPSSPLSDPNSGFPIRAHGVLFSAAGTYQFRDAMDAGLRGSVTVNP